MDDPPLDAVGAGRLPDRVTFLDPVLLPPEALDVTVAVHAILTHAITGVACSQAGAFDAHALDKGPQGFCLETTITRQFAGGPLNKSEVKGIVQQVPEMAEALTRVNGAIRLELLILEFERVLNHGRADASDELWGQEGVHGAAGLTKGQQGVKVKIVDGEDMVQVVGDDGQERT